ncbi:DUF2798 domain-containing protein [Treponema ruminis]|uniref:DUF2798 domain-containing protein n=1 Tax=Treponema ruminis TaxID=744515 RepID=A0A7W8GAJ6_9SPIR|nr:DUF2798 domain-containing protein [Treponema ruminis]MBB5226812.1 hypothetical protein [Treponema ruminis]QSI01967.1 DUF2798 domain-containing protein [Treponema ruminis]
MPKSLGQEILFTIMMVFVMVYAMICYNIALAMGGLSNSVFLLAFHELPIMAPIAFVIDFFIVGPLAKKITFSKFNPEQTNPVFIILSISICSVWMMCPLMSLAATILFKGGFQKEMISIWLQTTAFNYPMAAFWQMLVAGPLVRVIFGLMFKNKKPAAK